MQRSDLNAGLQLPGPLGRCLDRAVCVDPYESVDVRVHGSDPFEAVLGGSAGIQTPLTNRTDELRNAQLQGVSAATGATIQR